MTVTVDETDIQISIGGTSKTCKTGSGDTPAALCQMPFNGLTGDVTITMNGNSVTGPAISNTLPASGVVNFNAVAISL